MHPSIATIACVVVMVLGAGFFSAAEAALSSFSRTRVDGLLERKVAGAARLQRLLNDPAPHLNAALFLRLLCEITAIVLTTLMVSQIVAGVSWLPMVILVAGTLVVSFVVIGVGPRTVGRQHPEGVALLSAVVLVPVTRVLRPLTRLLILVGNAITPGKGFVEGPFSSEAELRELVDLAEASSLIAADERAMIHSVFELGDTAVREVMVPRTDVVFIEEHQTLREGMSLLLRSGYSRVPVIAESLDDIVGFAYLKDLLGRGFDNPGAGATTPVRDVMRSALHVPDSKGADQLLREMQVERRHIAVVVDEYGGTAGIVTIEDILEEIVGEIADEHDDHEVHAEILPDGSWRVPARFSLNDLADLTGVDVDHDDVDSVGGLLAKLLGTVPLPGSEATVAGLRLTAQAPTGRRKRIGAVTVSKVDYHRDRERQDEYRPDTIES